MEQKTTISPERLTVKLYNSYSIQNALQNQ